MSRRLIASMALLLMALLPVQAQKRWSLIPNVGLQVSQIRQEAKTHPLVSIKGGVLGEYRLTTGDMGRIYLQSGLLLTKKGATGDGGIPIPSYEVGSLEVPFLFNFDINLAQQINSFLRIGPYYSYSLEEIAQVAKDDYGLQIGIGAEYRHWIMAIDTGIGLHNIYMGAQGKAKHISGTLSVGYRF